MPVSILTTLLALLVAQRAWSAETRCGWLANLPGSLADRSTGDLEYHLPGKGPRAGRERRGEGLSLQQASVPRDAEGGRVRVWLRLFEG